MSLVRVVLFHSTGRRFCVFDGDGVGAVVVGMSVKPGSFRCPGDVGALVCALQLVHAPVVMSLFDVVVSC